MKSFYLKALMIGILLLSEMNVVASVEIDGIYYELSDKDNTASVTYHSKKWDYEGNIVIPSQIMYKTCWLN